MVWDWGMWGPEGLLTERAGLLPLGVSSSSSSPRHGETMGLGPGAVTAVCPRSSAHSVRLQPTWCQETPPCSPQRRQVPAWVPWAPLAPSQAHSPPLSHGTPAGPATKFVQCPEGELQKRREVGPGGDRIMRRRTAARLQCMRCARPGALLGVGVG